MGKMTRLYLKQIPLFILLAAMPLTIAKGYSNETKKPPLPEIQAPQDVEDALSEAYAIDLAKSELLSQDYEAYDKLRSEWRNSSANPAAWAFLDADKAVLMGKSEDAVKLLTDLKCKGSCETDRLVKLAALHLQNEPQKAWDYLSEAAENDQTNPDIHLYRASMLETANLPHLAAEEYLSAIEKCQNAPYFKEALSDLYCRFAKCQLMGASTVKREQDKPFTSPEILLLAGRQALKDDQPHVAFQALKEIYQDQTDQGVQATLLIVPLFLAQNDTESAKEAILTQSTLTNNVQARELLARAFYQEGEEKIADEIYLGIEPYSSEAKSYLAQKAYVKQDWKRAKLLTEQLLKSYPHNGTLQENLKAINKKIK